MLDPRWSRRRFLGVAASATAVGASGAIESIARTRDAKHFVLVHGAWHGAWCWYKIVAGLETAGHRVTTLDLPSGGIDGTAPETVTLQTQADRVIALLDSRSEPVILVGHSAGGPVISLAAEARSQKIAKLVYLTAFLLPDGDSQVTVVARDREALIGQHLLFHPAGTIEVDPAWRRAVFYADCDDADVALAQSLLKPNGLRPSTDPVRIGSSFASVRRFYITCRRDQAISPAAQKSMYTALPCEMVLSIASSHSPFLSRPTALLRALAKIARA
jgi:pimeloyl-ACP methyl ester carboxylesterase